MQRFPQPVFIASGLRTPFGRGGGALSGHDAASLSVPLVQAMAATARPDLFVWGTVIPNLGWSNIAREVWLDAGLDPSVPAFSTVLACSTSMMAAFTAAGMLGGSAKLALVGGAEVMSNPPIGLKAEASKRITGLFRENPAAAFAALKALTPDDLVLPAKGWANRITGRTMGDHMEETARAWSIDREAQDEWALKSHRRAIAGWENGFFDDLVLCPSRDRPRRQSTCRHFCRKAGLARARIRLIGQGNAHRRQQFADHRWRRRLLGRHRGGPCGIASRNAACRTGRPRNLRGRSRRRWTPDGTELRHSAAARAAWPPICRHRAVGDPRGICGTGSGQHRRAREARLDARQSRS